MAQVLKLKRTAVQGKIPTTDTLELGELAINTYDGKLYFEKDNGTPSVQSIVVTDALITGSINIAGAITSSYFKGDGSQLTFGGTGMVSGSSQLTSSLDSRYLNTLGEGTISGSFSGQFAGDGSGLTNLPASDISQVATVTASFDATSSIVVTHNFNSKNILVSVYGTNDAQIIPSSVVLTNNNTTTIGLSSPQSGYVVVAKGGHIVSGTLEVSAVATVTASFDATASIAVNHNFNSKNLVISVYNSNDSQIIPSSVTLTNLNTATIGLSSPQSGYVVVAKGGHLVTAVGIVSYNTLTDIPTGILSSSAVPAGTISGSSQLTGSYDTRYVLSGSITQTTWDNIASKPNGIISGSSQLTSSVLATTGSNTFVGTQTYSGSIIPATDNTYDLGSATYQWRDIYVSSGSLYIDGTKVLGSTNQELQITTDIGQSIKILESGTDSIILQSADGDIQLKTSGGGNLLFDPTTGLIDIRGTLQIQDGYKITSSGGNSIQFGNDLGITGSINTTGNINGVNLTTFSSSVASTFLNQNAATSSYETKGRGIVSGSSQIDVTQTQKYSTLATTGSNTFFGTQTFSGSVYIANDLIVQGSSSIQYISASSVSIGTNIVQLNTANPSVRFAGLTIIDSGSVGGSGSFLYDSVHDEFIFVHRGNGVNVTSSHFVLGPATYDNLGNETYLTNNRLPKGSGIEHLNDSNITDTGTLITLGSNTVVTGTLVASGTSLVSSSAQVVSILSSLNTYTGSNDTTNTTQNSRLTTIESVTGSYETKGRGIVSGSSQIDVMSTTNIARLATTGSNTFTGTQTLTGTTNLTDSTATDNGDKTVSIVGNKPGVGYHNINYNGYQHSFYVGGSQTLALTMGTTGNVTPGANGTQDLGSSTYRWSTVYTSDLSLNNGIGDWTIVEGEDDLFLYNNKKGKVYKFALTEVDPNVATPKKS